MKFRNLRFQWSRFTRHFSRFTWGGQWAAALPESRRHNLTLFFFDGLFAAASDKIILTYISIYLLDLGATGQQIGLLSSLSNLTAALLLLPAAMLVESTGERKRTTLMAASGSRLMVLLMALLPMVFVPTSGLVWVILGFALLRETFNNFGYPGWIALTGDIVPLEGRGRYFGSRNFIMGVSGIITALVIGQAITWIGSPLGYQLAFILAALLGVASMSFFGRLKDHSKEDGTLQPTQSSLRLILSSLQGQKQFILFCVFTAVWNFSINIAGPFFNVYMVETVGMTAASIGLATVGNSIANLVVQRRTGVLADRWGNRKVSIIFLFLIPALPLIWGLWIHKTWEVTLMQTVAGIFWGAYNLVSFNILLTQTPQDQRARFSALYQIVVTLSLAAGAALGSYLITIIQFKGVAIASAIGRWIAALLFILLVRESPPKILLLEEIPEESDLSVEEPLS